MTLWTDVAHDPKYVKVLDHGFVGLKDVMGDDSAITQAARVSYGDGTKSVNEDRGLIRYLMRHQHSTPFEMVEFKFHLKMPIFVMRQHVRHRMASINEYSGRYSVMTDEFYVPETSRLAAQSRINNQGSGDPLLGEEARRAEHILKCAGIEAYLAYLELINDPSNPDTHDANRQGLARELARTVLPLNNYTELYWKIDLKNLFHYLNLRADSHAQWEIRAYADTVGEFVKSRCPVAWEAFEDYWRDAVTVSKLEQDLLRDLITVSNQQSIGFGEAYRVILDSQADRTLLLNKYRMSKRELAEFELQWGLA